MIVPPLHVAQPVVATDRRLFSSCVASCPISFHYRLSSSLFSIGIIFLLSLTIALGIQLSPRSDCSTQSAELTENSYLFWFCLHSVTYSTTYYFKFLKNELREISSCVRPSSRFSATVDQDKCCSCADDWMKFVQWHPAAEKP